MVLAILSILFRFSRRHGHWGSAVYFICPQADKGRHKVANYSVIALLSNFCTVSMILSRFIRPEGPHSPEVRLMTISHFRRAALAIFTNLTKLSQLSGVAMPARQAT
jgi:hypothetical protein